jgi:hypothetical protein
MSRPWLPIMCRLQEGRAVETRFGTSSCTYKRLKTSRGWCEMPACLETGGLAGSLHRESDIQKSAARSLRSPIVPKAQACINLFISEKVWMCCARTTL